MRAARYQELSVRNSTEGFEPIELRLGSEAHPLETTAVGTVLYLWSDWSYGKVEKRVVFQNSGHIMDFTSFTYNWVSNPTSVVEGQGGSITGGTTITTKPRCEVRPADLGQDHCSLVLSFKCER